MRSLRAILTLLVLVQLGRAADEPTTIRVNGSDTMLQVGLKWQGAYKEVREAVTVSLNGEGSGVGIKYLIEGKADLAMSSRPMKGSEKSKFIAKHGGPAKEYVVGYDVIGIYAHPDNPTKGLTMEQLAKIFGSDAGSVKWSDITPAFDKPVTAVSRSFASGTYAFFKKLVLGAAKEMGKGFPTMPGSMAVVDFVASTPDAIGYSGSGYKTDKVKFLGVIDAEGKVSFPGDASYPLRRPLLIYSAGDDNWEVESLLRWIKSADGQAIVKQEGFVPIP